MFDKEGNPYYRMLMGGHASRQQARHRRRSIWIGFAVIVAVLPIVSSPFFCLSCGCSSLLIFLPVALATTFAQSSASDTRSADYELIMLTPLEDEHIVWGQIYSILDRSLSSRSIPYGLPYGLVPVLLSVMMVGAMVANLVGGESDFAVVLIVISVTFSFAGLYWLLGFTGIALGFAMRRPGIATWTMVGTSLVALFMWGIFFAVVFWEPDPPLTGLILFMLVPYLPIAPVLYLAYRFARNPLISPPA